MADRGSRLRPADLAREALAGAVQRPARSILTLLGTVLGIGSFVAVLGLTSTAGSQINQRFTVLAATEVRVEDVALELGETGADSFPDDAALRAERLNGVRHAGVHWVVAEHVPVGLLAASADPLAVHEATVVAMEPGTLAAVRPQLLAGRLYDSFHQSNAEPVVLVGRAVAAQLGLNRLDGQQAIFIDGQPYAAIGVIDQVARMPELLFSVIIPTSTARAAFGESDQPAELLVETEVGAAQQVADEVALALRPDRPELFRVHAPADPQVLRGDISSDLALLFLLLAGVGLVVGAFGIANTTLVAVLERTHEIGLRRAVGARRRHIAVQFLSESAGLGLLGGLFGASLGIAVVVGTALVLQWTAVIAPWTVAAAPVTGAMVGLMAGVYPAWRAASIEPATALHR